MTGPRSTYQSFPELSKFVVFIFLKLEFQKISWQQNDLKMNAYLYYMYLYKLILLSSNARFLWVVCSLSSIQRSIIFNYTSGKKKGFIKLCIRQSQWKALPKNNYSKWLKKTFSSWISNFIKICYTVCHSITWEECFQKLAFRPIRSVYCRVKQNWAGRSSLLWARGFRVHLLAHPYSKMF